MQKVHIIPVGFEVDRILLPLEEINADKVYLLGDKSDKKKDGHHFMKISESAIKEKVTKNVETQDMDFSDLPTMLSQLCKIISDEKEEENIVFINVSSGNTLSSIACTIAGMIYGAKLYYANTKSTDQYQVKITNQLKQKGMTVGPYNLEEIPHYTIYPPSERTHSSARYIRQRNTR